MRLPLSGVLGLALLLGAGEASAELSLTLLKLGGGFLVNDATSNIPLEVHVREGEGPLAIRAAGVKATQGKVTGIRVRSAGRVAFLYQPQGSKKHQETLSFTLEKKNGDRILLDLSFGLPEPENPELQFDVSPTEFDADAPESVQVSAAVSGNGSLHLDLSASHGALTGPEKPVRTPGRLELARVLAPPRDLPDDAPSHLVLVAAAADERGFAAAKRGVMVVAKLRISAEVPSGSKLVLEGTESPVEPVRAAADGRTVIEGRARYGSPVRAFILRGKRRKEIPIAVPAGFVPLAETIALPGQDVADAGTGPTLVVALPPAPLGAELYWPDLAVEGAKLVDTIELAPDVRVLVLERPSTPGPVSVLVDGVAQRPIPFRASFGRELAMEEAVPDRGERAALRLTVKDSFGHPTNVPTPKARLSSGFALVVEPSGEGEYRVVVPPTAPGEAGEEVTVVAELPPPTVIAGDPVELAETSVEVRLEGPAPAIRPDDGPSVSPPRPSVSGIKLRVGLSALALAGTTFGSQLLFGGAFGVELRMPFFERLALRTGFEAYRGTGQGLVRFQGERDLEATTAVGGTIIPIELGFVFLDTSLLEMMVRAGVGIRSESASLEVGGDAAGGGSRTGLSARTSLEAGFYLGPGTINLGVTLDGLGASASDLSGERVSFEGSLTNLRLDLGYRIWL